MQQTSIDTWIRRKYVYVTHVYANTLPRTIPSGVKVEETTPEMGGMYLYRFTAHTDRELNELTAHLEVANITYTSRVDDEKGTANKLFNNPNRSFTMQIAWVIVIISILAILFSGLPVHLWKTLSVETEEEVQKKQKKSSIIEFLTK
jgi:hypothetical protein